MSVHTDEGVVGPRERRCACRSRPARTAGGGSRSDAHRADPRDLRDGGLPRRPAMDARGGRLGSRGPRHRTAPVEAPRRPFGEGSRLRLGRAHGRAGGACPSRRCAPRRRDRGDQAAVRPEDWRTDIEAVALVREAVGSDMEIMVDANQGWRMPGMCGRGGTSRRPRSVHGPGAAGRLLARRAPARPTTSTATRGSGAAPTSGWRPVRWCASSRGARSDRARWGGRDPDRRGARGGHRRLPRESRRSPIFTARRGLHTRGRTATGSWQTSTRHWRSRPARSSRFRSIRRSGAPRRAIGSCRLRSRSTPMG